MRDYKFRGKRVDNGEWVYGWYFESVNYFSGETKPQIAYIKQVPSSMDRFIPAFEPIAYEVDPKTVGPYTGLEDKNGTEIYEGDIVKTEKGYYQDLFIVEYLERSFELTDNNDGFLADYNINWEEELEIIGNTFDNPELLERKE